MSLAFTFGFCVQPEENLNPRRERLTLRTTRRSVTTVGLISLKLDGVVVDSCLVPVVLDHREDVEEVQLDLHPFGCLQSGWCGGYGQGNWKILGEYSQICRHKKRLHHVSVVSDWTEWLHSVCDTQLIRVLRVVSYDLYMVWTFW